MSPSCIETFLKIEFYRSLGNDLHFPVKLRSSMEITLIKIK